MAIDTTELTGVFDVFVTKATAALKELQAETQMEDEFLSSAISTTLVGAMDQSVRLYQIDKQIAAEAANTQANITAEAPVRAAQAALLTQQKLTEAVRTEIEEYRNTILMVDEHFKNLGQITLTEKQSAMTIRQTTGFDDKKATDKAKLAEELVSAIYLSGGTIPESAFTWSKGLVDSL